MTELFIVGVAFLLFDQLSKITARSQESVARSALGGLLEIRYVPHRKVFYRRSSARTMMVLLWLTALASVLLLYRTGLWFQSPTAMIGIGCALGGAAGNLIDILHHGYVADFIDFGWWPVFNLADVGIVAGLLLAFLG